jgi:hypothetical protein
MRGMACHAADVAGRASNTLPEGARESGWLSESTSQNWWAGWRGGWTATVRRSARSWTGSWRIYAALKGGEGVSLRGFGSFYVRAERDSWVFKFNLSQRLRALFGWSSTYRGPL